MKEAAITKKLAKWLKPTTEDAWEVIIPTDNESLRGENAVSVVCDQVTQVKIGLPDYSYDFSIYISTHISEDEDGSLFEATTEEVEARIEALVCHDIELESVFEELPIVAAFFDGTQRAIVDDSSGQCNLAHLKLRLIASF